MQLLLFPFSPSKQYQRISISRWLVMMSNGILLVGFLGGQSALGQTTPPRVEVYKKVDTVELSLEFYYPDSYTQGQELPAIIFFFGGGWNGGSTGQFLPHAQYFASRGIIGVLADYRVKSRHGTSPFDAVSDAKAAIRYLRKHHESLGLDPDKIIGSGGSAGGHLAAATALVPGLEGPGQDLAISSRPNALVLFNPVYDNGPGQYGYNRVKNRYEEISPKHNIRKGAPPTLVFFGTEDPLVSPETALSYEAAMKAVGSRCETFLYEGEKHGFFNYRNPKNYRETVYQTDRFLGSLGYLTGKPTIYPKIQVLVWDEQQPQQLQVYPNYLGNHIAAHLKQHEDLEVLTARLDGPEQGLSEEMLDRTEVLIWWGHRRHTEISKATSRKLIQRVKDGKLHIIFLHSAHWANPFIEAMHEVIRERLTKKYSQQAKQVEIEYAYIPDSLRFRIPKLGEPVQPTIYERKFPDGRIQVKVEMPSCVFPFYRADKKPSTVVTVRPQHPIAQGIPASFTLPETEMYDEPFHVPEPDHVIFEERWEAGEWFRSGALWKIGEGHIFYFRPGHELYNTYFEPLPLKILENTVLWMEGFEVE